MRWSTLHCISTESLVFCCNQTLSRLTAYSVNVALGVIHAAKIYMPYNSSSCTCQDRRLLRKREKDINMQAVRQRRPRTCTRTHTLEAIQMPLADCKFHLYLVQCTSSVNIRKRNKRWERMMKEQSWPPIFYPPARFPQIPHLTVIPLRTLLSNMRFYAPLIRI